MMMMSRATLEAEQTQQYPEAGTMMPPLDSEGIKALIPHRYPFLLVDRVTEHAFNQYAVGYKNLTANESFFEGHFPGTPIMPGVLQIEALAQLAAVVCAETPKGKGKLGVFAGIEKARFRCMAKPGDRLDMRVEMLQQRSNICKFKGVASVDGQVAVEVEMIFSFLPPPKA